MATLWIAEFENLPEDDKGNIIPIAPLSRTMGKQQVTYTASAQSAALNPKTNYVRLVADAVCHVLGGENPTATADDLRMAANEVNFLYVGDRPKGTDYLIAGYDGSS